MRRSNERSSRLRRWGLMKLKRSRLRARCQQRFFNPLSSDAVGVSGFAMEFGLAVEFSSSSLAVAVAELDHERVSAAAGAICKPQFWSQGDRETQTTRCPPALKRAQKRGRGGTVSGDCYAGHWERVASAFPCLMLVNGAWSQLSIHCSCSQPTTWTPPPR